MPEEPVYLPHRIRPLINLVKRGWRVAGCGLRVKTNSPVTDRSKTIIESSSNDRGSVLITVIMAITILALLITAMSSFVPNSTFSQVGGYSSRQAFYLAESGYRYAASQFHDAGGSSCTGGSFCGASGQAAMFMELTALNQVNGGSALKLGANGADGNIALSVTPYFLVYGASYPVSASSFQLTYPGNAPPSEFGLPATGNLDVGINNMNVVSYTRSGNTYSITGGLPSAVQQYNSVRFVTNPSSGGSIVQGGNLTLANAGPFPPINGTFRVNLQPNSYQYQSKSGNTLQNITSTDPTHPGTGLPLPVSGTDNIICNEFAEIQSTGTSYAGTPQQTSRSVLYYASIVLPQNGSLFTTGPSGGPGADTMGSSSLASDSNWSAPAAGNAVYASGSTPSGNYLQMITASAGSGNGWWALLPISSSISANLSSAFASGSPHFYEAQAKILTGAALPYYAAGISFRTQTSGPSLYGYGLSFAYFPNNPDVSSDGIPNGLVPTDSSGNSVTQKPIILLWESTGSGYQWLAYKVLPPSVVNGSTGVEDWSTLLVSLEETGSSGTKYNQIRAYYGTTAQQGTGPNTIPTDNNSGKNPLLTSGGSPNWTPLDATTADWTASEDNFTLVQWDRVNPGSGSTLAQASDLPAGDGAEAGCVIKDSTFVTSSNEALSTPEILLHIAGNSISAGFDDFAVLGPAGSTVGFMNPIQQ